MPEDEGLKGSLHLGVGLELNRSSLVGEGQSREETQGLGVLEAHGRTHQALGVPSLVDRHLHLVPGLDSLVVGLFIDVADVELLHSKTPFVPIYKVIITSAGSVVHNFFYRLL